MLHAEVTIQNAEEHATVTDGKSRQTNGTAQVKAAYNGGNCRAEYSYEMFGRTTRQVLACNSKYAFRLEWRNNGWTLSEYAPAGSAKAKEIEADLLAFQQPARALVSLPEDPLTALADKLRVRPGQPHVLELAAPFRSVGSQHNKTYHMLTIDLNDDAFRTVKSISGTYVLDNASGARTSFTLRFESKVINGLPLPLSEVREETFTTRRGSGKSTVRNTYTIDPSIARPESDFTLSAYGLPEPRDAAIAQPGRRHVWFLAGAAAFAVLAAGLGYFARRRRQPTEVSAG